MVSGQVSHLYLETSITITISAGLFPLNASAPNPELMQASKLFIDEPRGEERQREASRDGEDQGSDEGGGSYYGDNLEWQEEREEWQEEREESQEEGEEWQLRGEGMAGGEGGMAGWQDGREAWLEEGDDLEEDMWRHLEQDDRERCEEQQEYEKWHQEERWFCEKGAGVLNQEQLAQQSVSTQGEGHFRDIFRPAILKFSKVNFTY